MVSEHFDPRRQVVWSDWVGEYIPRKIPNPFRSLAADRPYSLSGYGSKLDRRSSRSLPRSQLAADGIGLGEGSGPQILVKSLILDRSVKTTKSMAGNEAQSMGFDLTAARRRMMKSMVRYEEDATDPTAIWRIVHLRPSVEPRNIPDRVPPAELKNEKTRRTQDLRQINLNSTQGVQFKSTPEGNSKLPSTDLSVVATGWDQDPLPCSWASSTGNHQNPSQEPALDRQWLQNPKENLSQPHPQYQAKQWDSNPSNKRVLSVSTVDDDLSYSNNMKIEQMEQTKVKAKLCSVEYQPRWVPGKEILEQEVYGIDPYTHNLPKEIVPADLDWSIDDKAEVCGLFGSVFCDFGPEITVLDVDGEDPHTGITASISNDNPALVSCDDEADFHMKQDAFLYNLGAQMLPKSYHCFSRRLMLEYSKFSSLDSDEPFACKLNNPKHRDTYKQVNVHVLYYEAILWEKLPKFSMQQLYLVGLHWHLPPWPDLCAMICDRFAQHNGYEVLVNSHSVKKYHISLDKAFEFNDYCRSQQPSIPLIKAEVCCLVGSVFCDFGPEFTVLDVEGEDPHTGIIASISNDNPALVSCVDDERLEFQNGDLVVFSEVQGMTELNDSKKGPANVCVIEWVASATLYDTLQDTIRIAMVGKYTSLSDSYLSVLKALLHASVACHRKLVVDWVVRIWDPGTGSKNMKWQSSPLGVVGGLTFGAVLAAGRDQPEDLTLKVESALYSVGVAESFCTGQIDKLSFWSQGISQDSPVGTDEFMSLKKPTRLVLRVRKPRAVVNITPAVSSALLMNELQWIGLIVKPIDYSLKDGILHIESSAGLKIEEISTKLRDNCPSCFNVSDYKYYLIVENLERASMTNNHDGREILARDAFNLLTRIPDSADLSAICKRFEKRRFYEAVIQLILQKAQTRDPIADLINGQINVRPHDTTITQCEQCYQIVMNALSTLKGVGQRGTQQADQSSSSASALDSTSRSKYSNQLIPLSVQWPDTALHDHLYMTLIEFLEYGGFDLVAFLQSAGHKHQEEVREVSVVASKGSKLHDLGASISTIQTKYIELLVRYDVFKGEYIVVARSLLIWAEVQFSNAKEAPTLDQRYQYLSNAVLQAKGKIAVLRFQTQIKQELEYMAFWLEHIPGSSELLSDPFPRDNIIADAETAITATDKAIKHVFPSTQHCFSYWHILKNAQPHLGTVYTFQAYQKKMCMKCIQGSDSEMELEESWTAMLHEHKTHDNNWLNDLSRFHHRWCSVFNKDTFETGINSSQWGRVPNNILTGIADESTFLIRFSLLLEKVVHT